MSENPISRALDEAGDEPDARAFTVPVELVRRSAAKRRALRSAGAAAVALVVVGGAAGGVSAGLNAWRGDGPAGPDGGVAADWPGQFSRCGQALDDVLPAPLSSARLILDPATVALPADGDWEAAVTAEVGVAGDDLGWVWGTDLLVVRDGVVVGVQDGPSVPDVGGIEDWLGGAAIDRVVAPFPLTADVTLGLASCDQYPDGEGSPTLTPGTYDLVVAQTVSYLGDEGQVDVRLGTQTTVTVTDATGVPAPGLQPIACGATADELAHLASPEWNPQAFPIEAEVTGEALVGQPLPMAFSVPAGAADFLSGGLEILDVRGLLTRDGVVGGDAERYGESGPTAAVGVPQDCRAREAATSEPEGGFPLGGGEYDVWLVLDLRQLNMDGPGFRVAGGPWPVTLVDRPAAEAGGSQPSADEDDARALAYAAAESAVLRCEEPVDGTAAAMGTSTGLALQSPAPGGTWGWVPPPWSGSVVSTDGRTREVRVQRGPRLAVLRIRATSRPPTCPASSRSTSSE